MVHHGGEVTAMELLAALILRLHLGKKEMNVALSLFSSFNFIQESSSWNWLSTSEALPPTLVNLV